MVLFIFFSEKLKNRIRVLFHITEGGDHMNNNDIGEIIITLLDAAIKIIRIWTDSKDE